MTVLTDNTAPFALSSRTNIESGPGLLSFTVSCWLASATVAGEGIDTHAFKAATRSTAVRIRVEATARRLLGSVDDSSNT